MSNACLNPRFGALRLLNDTSDRSEASLDLISSFLQRLLLSIDMLPLSTRPNTSHSHGCSSNNTTHGSADRHPSTPHLSTHNVLLVTRLINTTASTKVLSFRNRNVALLRPRLFLVGSRRPLPHPTRNEPSSPRLYPTLPLAISPGYHKTYAKTTIP